MWPLALCRFRPLSIQLTKRFISSSTNLDQNTKIQAKREQNALFDTEVKRQASLIPRIEKILVTMKDIKPGPGEVVALMNKGLSTPYNCAQHISELYVTRSVVAEINSHLVDMHYPLQDECTLRFRHFNEPNCSSINHVYWRSCSFILGACISNSFRSDLEVYLHSYPKPDVNSGSFVYDVKMPKLENWTPTEDELTALNRALRRIKAEGNRFQRLTVSKELAKEIFKRNPYKLQQIEGLEDDRTTLYRAGDHIDMSVGPMIPDTSFIGLINIVAVHQVVSKHHGKLYRFQGTSIPKDLLINHFTYKLLVQSAEKLNPLSPL